MAKEVESSPEELLPSALRRRWIAIPRYRLWHTVTFFSLLSASLALWIVGLVEGIRWMMYTPPLVVAAFWFANLFLKRRDRQDEEDVQRFKQSN